MIRRGSIAAILLIASISNSARATWPDRVFAPYMYIGSGDDFKLTTCDDATGLKHYTLAFIIADAHANPAWDGRIPMDKNFYAIEIDAIRQRGGDVIISFGGEGGTELSIAERDPAKILSKYQSIIDQYKFTWLDFDIEGKALRDTAANARRNTAIAALQAKSPDLIISYTLPVDPQGIPTAGLKLLADAKAKGVKVHSANIMVMDFGPDFLTGKTMADVAIASAVKAHSQILEIDPAIQIGLCPMIGQNDVKAEIFTLDDAKSLRAFADQTPWICSLSFWSINRDNGTKKEVKPTNTSSGIPQPTWAFTEIFKSFTTATPPKP